MTFKHSFFGSVAALITTVVFSLPGAAQVRLIGGTSTANPPNNSSLYEVSAITGAATDPRATGISNLYDIEYLPGVNKIFGINGTSVFTISEDGTSALLGNHGLTNTLEGDLAYDPVTQNLQFITNSGPGSFLTIYTINQNTGQVTATAPSTFETGDFSGAAYTTAGQLYVLDTAKERLLQVSSTAFVTNSFALSQNLGSIAGFDIDPDTGIAYVVDGNADGTKNLLTLNLSNGTLTTVGALGNSEMSGITIGPPLRQAAAPEPGAMALLLTALPAMAWLYVGKSRWRS